MALIKKIEIICKPCDKCRIIEENLNTIVQCIEFKYNIKMKFELVHIATSKEIVQLGYGVNELPVLRINGETVFSGGRVVEAYLLRNKLEEIMRQ